MATGEIPREQWVKFFDDFSKRHEGWTVTLDVLRSDLGDQKEASNLPLVGISADPKQSGSAIEIMVGGQPDAHVTRIINRPKSIWVKELERPGHEAIEIESEDGIVTLVSFLHVDPEQTERQLPPS